MENTGRAPALYRQFWPVLRMLFRHQGIVREFRPAFYRISRQAWRSAQPSPWRLRSRLRKYGIRTVVNLREDEDGYLPFQMEAALCRDLGVKYLHLTHYSRAMPRKEALLLTRQVLREIEYPALFHCKSGSDRSGLVANLYLHWVEGLPIDECHNLRFFPYMHCRWGKPGILDVFFERYLEEHAASGISFDDWIEKSYDAKVEEARFVPITLWQVWRLFFKERPVPATPVAGMDRALNKPPADRARSG